MKMILTDKEGTTHTGKFDGIFEARWGRKRKSELTVRLDLGERFLAMPMASVKSLHFA